ncbi:MAG: hypothetical protein GTN67_12365 [Hydrotalea flava]|uniref:hypothetical protein n=1 Tax=Hydrotalea TaxID=1004300 RepID=UPI0010267FA7|nr:MULTISPECIES: hypothetical protein [Hydrotalea]MBY0347492.1 hypothetical protein [Hydrotalea flava]NIM36122.1 hypothetical protein [Hydrotalea flava]NIM38969.1 hypothetical protein [Hydrotalea flava]NIN04158.1 hypothetical protein [Hydrotalea flava]NIN15831.1 hypothetical protein [Hydrotalea flava]
MEQPIREKHRKNFIFLSSVRDIFMALLYLGMSVLLFGGKYWQIPQIMALGDAFCYFLGSVCLLYGGFRMYRGIKKMY